jgi:hypothetical protein
MVFPLMAFPSISTMTPGSPSGVAFAKSHEEMNPIRDARDSPMLFFEIPVEAVISMLVSGFDERMRSRISGEGNVEMAEP